MIKRLLDIVVSVVALIALAIPILVIGLLVRIVMGAPVLFRQVRAGRGDRLFRMMKFRTMRDQPPDRTLSDLERLGRFGAVLRSYSLDEVPQIWHVLTGEMSLVGPRPLPAVYLPRYTDTERRRHEVRPGLTGWAQVNGRNAISWDEKLALDVWYVDHQSLGLDLKILALTALKLVMREAINSPTGGTMAEFRPELAGRD